MGDESQPTHEVFISYSSKDKKWADAACAVLERHRIRCWVAPRDITPGTEWGAAIISGMDASKIMVLIFSAHANESAQVRREVERAIGKGLIVLPFRVEDVKPAGAMEYALSNTHWLDGFTPPVERHLDFLARSVSSLLTNNRGESPEPPDRPMMTPVPSWPYGRLLIAGGLAVLTVIIVAGLFAMFRGRTVPPIAETAGVRDRTVPPIAETVGVRDKTVPPIAETASRSDQDRIQGRWQTVEGYNASTRQNYDAQLGNSTMVWTFQGAHATGSQRVDGEEVGTDRGLFSLSQGVERRLIDFAGIRPNGVAFELKGIYEFEGEFLKVCYSLSVPAKNTSFKRPDSFVVEPGSSRVYVKFRRFGDP
jgi:uncharacterized protein (TIGR03067 family)